MIESLKALADAAVAQRVAPGGVVVFGNRQRRFTLPFGTTQYEGGSAVSETTLYDIASLTKPVATVTCAMSLVADKLTSLDQPVTNIIPAVDRRITVAHLLGHAAGYPAHRRYFTELVQVANPRAELFARAASEALEYVPGQKTVYSDIGYILLGHAMEVVTGQRLDQLFAARVATPLQLSSTRYVDLINHESIGPDAQVAPTELYADRGLAAGEVHDENAHAAGGILGHAGLFSTAPDIARFAAGLCSSWHGRGAFDSGVVRAFLTTSAAPNTSWRLGWDTPSTIPGVSHAGDRWPRATGVGHLAFTGCSLWMDPVRQWYAVLLSNRVHPSRDGQGIREFRRSLMDEIAAILENLDAV